MMRGRDIKISGPFLWGIRIMAIIPAFQAGDAGSIPVFPSILYASVMECIHYRLKICRPNGIEGSSPFASTSDLLPPLIYRAAYGVAKAVEGAQRAADMVGRAANKICGCSTTASARPCHGRYEGSTPFTHSIWLSSSEGRAQA